MPKFVSVNSIFIESGRGNPSRETAKFVFVNRHDFGRACSSFCSSSSGIQSQKVYSICNFFLRLSSDLSDASHRQVIGCLRLPLFGSIAVPRPLIYLPSLVKYFTVSVGFFNSVLKNSGYILMSSSGEIHTKCSLPLSSVKLSLIGAKVSGTFM